MFTILLKKDIDHDITQGKHMVKFQICESSIMKITQKEHEIENNEIQFYS